MYTRQEAAQLKQLFWTSFGQYMAPVPSADGQKINWVNYKTGVKDLHFKMEADNQRAIIYIELAQQDAARQRQLFTQLLQLKKLFRNALQEEWEWVLLQPDAAGKITSRISCTKEGVNVYKKDDWPAIISFFKPRLVALDACWTDVKDGFS
jgi:Domain of unknown function (DUF4268)